MVDRLQKVSIFGVILDRIFPHADWIRIQTECGKMRTRITPNMDTFHPVRIVGMLSSFHRQIFRVICYKDVYPLYFLLKQ